MTLTDLIKSAEEKLANPDLTIGTRRREEAILHHLTSLEMYVDFAGGVAYTVDNLIRHKWPEEKPENLTWVLIRNKGHFGNTHHNVSWYVEDEGFYVAGFDEPFDGVIHWWNLPEVTE